MSPREKSHCVRGHPLSGSNIRIQQKDGFKKRVCLQCQAINRRAFTLRRVHARLAAR